MKFRTIAVLAMLGTIAAAPVPPDGTLTVAQLRGKYLTKADHIADIGGVEVRYRDEGHGPAVLLLHGSNSTLDTWDGVAAKLVPHYRVIRFDQPPQGLSGPISDAAKVTLPSPDALMTGLLDRLNTGPVIAVGVSSGGTMAYYLAGLHPDRVRALILSNAPSDPLDTAGLVNPPDLVAAEARAKATGRRDKDWWWAYFRSLYGDPARISAAQIERNYDMGRRVAEPNLLHLYALAGNNDLTHDRLAKVTAPTLIVWGMRDHVLPYPAAVALQGHLTAIHPSLLLLDDVGHYPPIEVPDRFAAIIDAFATQVVAKASPAQAAIKAP